MDSRLETYWTASATPASEFPSLEGEVTVDIAIVGGGIVGITTARLLKSAGLRVVVVEARRVGGQVTGKSTAKITSQHGLRYARLVRKHGEDKARLYAAAQEAGLRRIVDFNREHDLAADVEPMPAYIYALEERNVAEIEKEVEVARRLGLPASLTREVGLPFAVRSAMKWDNQAQFHPLKYVAALARTIPGEGSSVFENSRVTDWNPERVSTDKGLVRARHVVMATHLPLGQLGYYYTMAYPKAEPVVAAPITRVPQGMYLSADQPTRSIRTHTSGGVTYGIAAGEQFKPGHTDEERKNLAEIESWLIEHFDARSITHRWINEDYKPMDDLPFVGWSSNNAGNRYLVATGFDAWGITNGTAAAMLIADLIAGKDNPWAKVYDATRINPLTGVKDFVSENLSVAAHLVGGYLARKPTSFADIAPGQAAVLKISGEDVAAFKDETGQIHAVSAKCSHMGCLLGWNDTDRTWDCACHGSRFDLRGAVLSGPAVSPLERKADQT